ncbi:MAG: YajQ family cyclic di-GMP-binding protein [Myxococcales bacterium]|nr:YajQ family cyclic di-GMP-binding protein [Myxococcales bacterium]MDD9970781.1 YajQ family cyclic di-GMP-binding protein [Myxococcales bacterium]
MPSFDVVSRVVMHEVDNAVQQASKELSTRFDFRGTDSTVERTDDGLLLKSNSEGRLEAAWEVLREKMVKRKVSLKALDAQQPEQAGGSTWRQLVKLNQGISTDKGKDVVKYLKTQKQLKVQGAIQGDQVRVTGKKRDDLQEAIRLLKEQDFGLDLQFENFRD